MLSSPPTWQPAQGQQPIPQPQMEKKALECRPIAPLCGRSFFATWGALMARTSGAILESSPVMMFPASSTCAAAQAVSSQEAGHQCMLAGSILTAFAVSNSAAVHTVHFIGSTTAKKGAPGCMRTP